MYETSDFLGKVFQRNDNIVSRKIAEEMILVPIRGNVANMQQIYMLNPVAEYIWDHLESTTTLAEVRDGVLENFEINHDEAEKDLLEFIRRLSVLELVSEKA
jgi:hypothetical protein